MAAALGSDDGCGGGSESKNKHDRNYGDWLHLVHFLPCFTRETTLVTSCFAFLHTKSPSEKGSTLKGKNLLPKGANSFHFRVDPFSEGDK